VSDVALMTSFSSLNGRQLHSVTSKFQKKVYGETPLLQDEIPRILLSGLSVGARPYIPQFFLSGLPPKVVGTPLRIVIIQILSK